MKTLHGEVIISEVSKQTYVHIITGGINAGKTRKLLSIYHEIGRGDGFINTKVFHNDLYIGQRIVRLSTGESEHFSFKEGFAPSNWDEEYRYDVYCFSKKGMMFAYRTVSDIIAKGIEPVFIDEIGPLELMKKGFFHILILLLKMKNDVYITVRNSCVESVIKEFGIGKYQIIEV